MVDTQYSNVKFRIILVNKVRMTNFHLARRVRDKVRRMSADLFAKRIFRMNNKVPMISFTFDDFPKSAYLSGGRILNKYGLKGSYYISLGMMNTESDTGYIADLEIIKDVRKEGHELGCHTYFHSDSYCVRPEVFESSIIKNQSTFAEYFPNDRFMTFAYPYGVATPHTKMISSKYFVCSRGGKQTFNAGRIDLNYLNAYFIDKRKNESLSSIKRIISENCSVNGWLIFVTHGVDHDACPYGCTPQFLEDIINYSINSGSVILPVIKAFEKLSR